MILWRNIEIFHFFHFDSDPRFPHFYYMLGGNLGSLLYGDVSVMYMYTYIVPVCSSVFELRHKKFCLLAYAKTKAQISCAVSFFEMLLYRSNFTLILMIICTLRISPSQQNNFRFVKEVHS